MVRSVSMKLIPALLLCFLPGAASASGFQLMEQSASGLGNAFAGSAAVADNASTIYFNPAGMTHLQAREVSGGLSIVKPSFSFSNQGSNAGNLAGTGNGGDAGDWAFIPNGYASWALSKDLYVGIGVSAPFGLKTEYDDRWIGAAQSQMFSIKTININPSVAYRISEKISLGFGVNWQKIDAKYDRLATSGVVPTGLAVPATIDGSLVKAKMQLSDDAWGWNIGTLIDLSASTKLGFSYRSQVKYNTSGDVKLESDGSVAGNTALAVLRGAGRQSDVKASLTLPDTFIMSVTQKLSDRWEMLGDVSWTGWSSIPKVDIMRTSGVKAGDLAQRLDTEFRDAWRVALGANYKYNDAWKIKYGVAYDQTPVKDKTVRLVSLPDNDRVWVSLGAQWAMDKAQRFDFGAAYIYVRDSKIDNNQLSSARGRVIGEYEGNIWVFGAQYSASF